MKATSPCNSLHRLSSAVQQRRGSLGDRWSGATYTHRAAAANTITKRKGRPTGLPLALCQFNSPWPSVFDRTSLVSVGMGHTTVHSSPQRRQGKPYTVHEMPSRRLNAGDLSVSPNIAPPLIEGCCCSQSCHRRCRHSGERQQPQQHRRQQQPPGSEWDSATKKNSTSVTAATATAVASAESSSYPTSPASANADDDDDDRKPVVLPRPRPRPSRRRGGG